LKIILHSKQLIRYVSIDHLPAERDEAMRRKELVCCCCVCCAPGLVVEFFLKNQIIPEIRRMMNQEQGSGIGWTLLRAATVVLGVLSSRAEAALPTDFFYNIDGISVDLSGRYFCTLEQVAGHDIGGAVRCFGNDKIVPPNDVFMQVSTSARGACGITLQQEVKCWGADIHLHDRHMEGLFTQISGGENVICGLRINGAISCFYGE
jgi:hypothetical protein